MIINLKQLRLQFYLGQSQWKFYESFIALNIINFADMTSRENE